MIYNYVVFHYVIIRFVKIDTITLNINKFDDLVKRNFIKFISNLLSVDLINFLGIIRLFS